MKLTRFLKNRRSLIPRQWSNEQLRRCGALFGGAVVNVSGWRDEDKQGGHYRDYFPNATSYAVTNFTYHQQNTAGELFLDLTAPLPLELVDKFDVVFNHTVLEHIYECRVAFANLCKLSRDIVIVVVPFLQPYHAPYGDFWRFTPLTLEQMYKDSGLSLLTCSFNEHWFSSVYLFAIGTKDPEKWTKQFASRDWLKGTSTGRWPGVRAIPTINALRRASK
jgi:hypothetical protein